MQENSDEKLELRRYLLGAIAQEIEKERIEKRMMSDHAYFEEFLFQQDELIQAYIDGELPDSEVRDFESRFLASKKGREKIQFTRSLKKHIAERSSDQADRQRRPYRGSVDAFLRRLLSPIPIAAVFLLALSAVAIWYFLLRPSPTDEALLALTHAFDQARPLESRITKLGYARYLDTRSGLEPPVNRRELTRAQGILARQAGENSVEYFHVMGRFSLVSRRFDEAIIELESARNMGQPSAELLNDLGVAYLEKYTSLQDSDRDKSPELLLQALDSFEQSIVLKPSLLDSHFNKALCLEQMELPNRAIEAWREYLELDGASQWSNEARAHIQQLTSKLTAELSGPEREDRFLKAFHERNDEEAFTLVSQNRELITGSYLPQRLAFSIVTAAVAERKQKLAALKYLGSIERSRTGDAFGTDLAMYYAGLSEYRIQLVRKAQEAVVNGYDLCSKTDKFGEAMEQFKIADADFVAAGDQIESNTIAKYFIAYCLYNLSQFRSADNLLKSIGEFSEKRRYRWFALMNYCWWLGSQERLGYGTLTETRQRYEEALSTAQSMNDQYMIQKFLVLLVQKSDFVQQKDTAFMYVHKLLAVSNQPGLSVRQKVRNFDKIISVTVEGNFPSFSDALVFESVFTARTIADPVFAIGSELNVGNVYTQTGNLSEAEKWLLMARQDVNALPEESSRSDYLSKILLGLGKLETKRDDLGRAIEYFDDVLRLVDNQSVTGLQYETRKRRLFALHKLGRETDVAAEIPVQLTLAEAYRGLITDEKERNDFYNKEAEVYDLAVDLAFQRENFEEAYDDAEVTNSRSLLDWLSGEAKVSGHDQTTEIRFSSSPTLPLRINEIREKLPPAVQVLQFRILRDKVLIWVVSRDQFLTFSSPVSADELESRVKRYLQLIQGLKPEDERELSEISQDLYHLLIDPARPFLDADKEVCIIPDRILFFLPFTSLRSQSDRYFLDEFVTFYSPSANVLLRTTENARAMSGPITEKLLVVGNPAFDRNQFPKLLTLPDAAEEARTIASLYAAPKMLLDKMATKEEFQSLYKDYEAIHIATHYLVHPGYPMASKLVMAKSSEGDSSLTNGEIIREKLPATRLVVLAACQTGVEDYFSGEGLIGLSRTFLATGVPLVVASQWPADSRSTNRLMAAFHRYRKREGLSTAQALRKVQSEMAHDKDGPYGHPYYWAAFAVFGGYAEF